MKPRIINYVVGLLVGFFWFFILPLTFLDVSRPVGIRAIYSMGRLLHYIHLPTNTIYTIFGSGGFVVSGLLYIIFGFLSFLLYRLTPIYKSAHQEISAKKLLIYYLFGLVSIYIIMFIFFLIIFGSSMGGFPL